MNEGIFLRRSAFRHCNVLNGMRTACEPYCTGGGLARVPASSRGRYADLDSDCSDYVAVSKARVLGASGECFGFESDATRQRARCS